MNWVLFVGVAWYTKHYERTFFRDVTFWTIDLDSGARRFAARSHITASLTELEVHFASGYFDLIICNGVYGHGLDTLEECERAFDACYECLHEGGHMVLGWNDVPEHTPVPLESIRSLRRFSRESLAEWRLALAHRYAVPTRVRFLSQTGAVRHRGAMQLSGLSHTSSMLA